MQSPTELAEDLRSVRVRNGEVDFFHFEALGKVKVVSDKIAKLLIAPGFLTLRIPRLVQYEARNR